MTAICSSALRFCFRFLLAGKLATFTVRADRTHVRGGPLGVSVR